MLYLVFQSKGEALPGRELPPEYKVEFWRPGWARLVPPSLGMKFALWWVLHSLRLFRNRDYSALIIRCRGRVVHRTCLIPRYFRWPFMRDQDLQVSSTWTHPAHRRQGLATYALQVAASQWTGNGRTLWYVTHDHNRPSLGVCRSVGFSLLAEADRTERFGLRILGQLVLLDKPEVKV